MLRIDTLLYKDGELVFEETINGQPALNYLSMSLKSLHKITSSYKFS
jgi:hypothetical protein